MKQSEIYGCVVTAVCVNWEDILCCLYVASFDIRNDIKKKLGTVLMKYEIPKIFIRTKMIPKSRNGKILSQLSEKCLLSKLKGEKTYDS